MDTYDDCWLFAQSETGFRKENTYVEVLVEPTNDARSWGLVGVARKMVAGWSEKEIFKMFDEQGSMILDHNGKTISDGVQRTEWLKVGTRVGILMDFKKETVSFYLNNKFSF